MSASDGGSLFKNVITIGITRVKLVINWIQVTILLIDIFPDVKWPKNLIDFSIALRWLNLDVPSLLTFTSCEYSIPFPGAFTMHMITPLILIIVVGLSLAVSNALPCTKKRAADMRKAAAIKVMVMIMGIMYPGLNVRIFQAFHCEGSEGDSRLIVDFSVHCRSYDHPELAEEHNMLMVWAFIFLGVYIIGYPSLLILMLRLNKAHLHDVTSSKHTHISLTFGSLYAQCKSLYDSLLCHTSVEICCSTIYLHVI